MSTGISEVSCACHHELCEERYNKLIAHCKVLQSELENYIVENHILKEKIKKAQEDLDLPPSMIKISKLRLNGNFALVAKSPKLNLQPLKITDLQDLEEEQLQPSNYKQLSTIIEESFNEESHPLHPFINSRKNKQIVPINSSKNEESSSDSTQQSVSTSSSADPSTNRLYVRLSKIKDGIPNSNTSNTATVESDKEELMKSLNLISSEMATSTPRTPKRRRLRFNAKESPVSSIKQRQASPKNKSKTDVKKQKQATVLVERLNFENSDRPKRKAKPTCLSEPSLKKKLRKENQ